MISNDKKVVLVFENLFSYGGENRVNQRLAEMFPNADIFALFGTQKFADKYFNGKKIKFSFLNRYPFIKNLYTYYLPLWPIAVESFNLSQYDLVISCSHSVAKGCITSADCIHISYVNTPMRFLWDLKSLYSKHSFFTAPFLNYLRCWGVASSSRPDKIICNSQFINTRCRRYWGREADTVIYPPVNLYEGKLIPYEKRDNFLVAGAPFAENKGGRFIIDRAKDLNFNLKIIGKDRGYSRLKRYAGNAKNIQFLGRISEEEKWNVISNSKGFVASGIEDFGIFPVEAMSCGTPVLALRRGGYMETVKEDINGFLYSNEKDFETNLKKILNTDWDVEEVSNSVKEFSADRFRKEVEDYIINSI